MNKEWEDALNDYKESMVVEDLAPGSQLAYNTWASQLGRWAVKEELDLADIGPSALAKYRDKRIATSTASAVADSMRGAVRFLRWCQKQGVTDLWPSTQKPPRAPSMQPLAPRWLSDIEADRLLREAKPAKGAGIMSWSAFCSWAG